MRYYGVQNEVKSYLNRLQSEDGIEPSSSTIKTLNDRVESLKRSGVWSQYSLGFNDTDADSYFRRATVRDVLGRSEVCWFVRGMKALGLWQNAVCWPLKGYQNAGTGSTVYSLGGLGIFNGSLLNSPTWSQFGISFGDNTNRYMTTNLTPALNSNYNFFAAMQCLSQGATFNAFASTRLGTGGFTMAQQWNGNNWNLISWEQSGIWNDITITPGIIDGTYHTALCRINCTPTHVIGLTIDAGTEITSTGTNVVQTAHGPFIIGAETTTNNRSFDGNLSFVVYILQSNVSANTLNTLYKQTLGNGLGLP